MYKKLLALALAVMVVFPSLVGFSQPKSVRSSISVIVGSEPATLDPSMNETVDGATYVLHAFEGLTRVSKDLKTIPGVAYKWTVSKDGLNYTFYLRKSKWSDGKPVKAQDFEYAWKRTLDPKTGSPYASQLYYVKGAKEWNEDKAGPDGVGVKATGDYTLKVTLKAPCAYFLDLLRTPTYMPLRKDVIEKYGAKWTQSIWTYIGNGAYKMAKWTHNSELVFTKNPNYWSAGSILLKDIRFKLTDDDTAALNSFETGAVDLVDGLIPQAELANLIKAKKVKVFTQVGTYYLFINTKKAPFNNPKVRKALSLAIDREYIVNKVTKAGQQPAVAIVPYTVPGYKKTFREESQTYLKTTAQVAEAKKLLAEAGYPNGKGFPTDVELYYNTQSGHKAIMEAIMEMWKKNLGITVKSPNMEWKVLTEKVNNRDYSLSRMGWIGDYNDPMTFLDMFMTGHTQNKMDYSNPTYDKLVGTALASGDQKVRMEAMRKAEEIAMKEVPVIPVYYYVLTIMDNPKLKGYLAESSGFLYFHYAYTVK